LIAFDTGGAPERLRSRWHHLLPRSRRPAQL